MDLQEIQALRKRVVAGETITPEESRAAVKALREGRVLAATASTKRKKAAAPVDIGGLFGKKE